MASGSFYNYPVSSFGLYCTWESTPDNANNQSTVTFKTYLSYYTLNAISQTATTSVNGVSKSFTAPAINVSSASSWTKKLLNTRTETIKHNSDGTKQITLQASYPFNGKYSGTSIGTITASKTVALDNIKTACTAPTSFTVTSDNVDANGYNEAFETKLTLKWSGAKAGIGNAITDYQISYATNSDNSTWNWVNLQKVTSTSTSGSLTVNMSSKVSRGNYVRFRIQVLGSAGSSYYSGVTTASYANTSGGTSYSVKRNPYTACTAPTSVTASSNNFENTVTISWSGASGGASNSISSYYIQYATSPNNTTWESWTNLTTVSSTATSGSQSIDMSSKVSRGHYVKFRVRTQGSAGGSYYSDYTSSSAIRRQDYTACVAPTRFDIVSDVLDNPFETSVTLRWSGASGGTANSISSYYIQYAVSSDNSTWNTWSDLTIINSTVTSGDVTFDMSSNVPRGYYVKFRIQVRGSAGSSYYSDYTTSLAMRRQAYTACTAPTSFIIVSDLSGDSKYDDTLFENKVTLQWSGASSGINNAISGYNIYCAIRQSIGENIDWNYQLLTDIATTNNADSINLDMLQLSKSIIAILDDGSTKSLTEVPRTYYVRFKIETKGNAGSSYYSEKKTASYSQRDGSTAYSIRRNPYTQCGLPTDVIATAGISGHLEKFENEILLEWGEASNGENNKVVSYLIKYRTAPTVNELNNAVWIGDTIYTQLDTVSAYFELGEKVARGHYVEFAIKAQGSAGDLFNSDFVYSNYLQRDELIPVTNFRILSPLSQEYSYGEYILLAWEAEVDGSAGKELEVRYNTNDKWSNWILVDSALLSRTLTPNDDIYKFIPNNSMVQFRLRAKSYFGVFGEYLYSNIITRCDNTGISLGFRGQLIPCQVFYGVLGKFVDCEVYAGEDGKWKPCSATAKAPSSVVILKVDDPTYYFQDQVEQTYLIELPMLDTSDATDFTGMCQGCYDIITIPLYDTSNGTIFVKMFNECSSLQTVPLLNTSKGEDMSRMFAYCSSLTDLPMLDTSSNLNFEGMFSYCKSLETIPLFNTSKGINFSGMFASCDNFTTLPLLDMSSADNVDSMFIYCNSLTTIPALDLSNVRDFGTMFYKCKNLKIVPSLNTSNGSCFDNMFAECTNLQTVGEIDFSGYGKGEKNSIDRMFYNCPNLMNITFKPNSLKLDRNYIHNTQGIFGNSNNISAESLVSFFNAFQDNTGGTNYTITLPTSLYIKLSAEQLAIATNKNITIAQPSY